MDPYLVYKEGVLRANHNTALLSSIEKHVPSKEAISYQLGLIL